MSVRAPHAGHQYWFVTFTCFKWFSYLKEKKIAETVAFVIMSNHVHAIIYLADENTNLNKLLVNAKRFMAYDMIKLLEAQQQIPLLNQLFDGVAEVDKRKGQKHRVFEPSFDAKEINTLDFFNQKLDYIHNNPVKGKWSLADTITDYGHSSASFYELGVIQHFKPFDYRDVWVF